MASMRNIEKSLSGDNLVLFHNIQETIRLTQQKVNNLNKRFSQEDIFPILGFKRVEGSSVSSGESKVVLTRVSSAGEIGINAWKKDHHLQRNNGLRDLAAERSDFMYDEEKLKSDVKDGRLSKITPTSSQAKFLKTKESTALADQLNPEGITNEEIDMHLYDELTPEEQKNIYERICDRYGQESGRRYLLVRSMKAPDDTKIEAWTTNECPPTREKKFSKDRVSCPEYTPNQLNYIYPNVSEEVRMKMETLVDITPTCTTESKARCRKWKHNLTKAPPSHFGPFHMSIKGDSGFSLSSMDSVICGTSCQCGTYRCDCSKNKEKCDIPKIKNECYLMPDEVNNFLITCRENLLDNKLQDRRTTVSQMHAVKSANRVTRESVYLESSHNQARSELETCLMKVMPPQGQEVSEKGQTYVEELANVFAEHKMIPEQEWRAWRYMESKMANSQNSDELDSIDSDILTSDSSENEMSECNLRLSNTVNPSRIPYLKETYELANVFFDKLNAKIEKLIYKNHDKSQIKMKHPVTSALLEKINLLRSSNKIFNQITKCHKNQNDYPKKLTPFSERKRRKRVRANTMQEDLIRRQRFRKRVEGIQLGKTYTKPNRSFLFTKSEKFRGFSPRRRKLLCEPGDIKFAKCNLVGKNLAGRAAGQKTMHYDYRLIRKMFDDDMNRKKENLWEPSMMATMMEYSGMFQSSNNATLKYEQEGSKFSLVSSRRRPNKEEQKIQTATPYCTLNAGNAAEALTTMIRSLRNASTRTLSASRGNPNPRHTTSQTDVSPDGPCRDQSGRISSGFGQESRWKSHRATSVRRNSELNRTYTVRSNTILARSTDLVSVPQSDCTVSSTSRKTTLKPMSPSKTLPPLHSTRPNIKHLFHNSRFKSSKTVR